MEMEFSLTSVEELEFVLTKLYKSNIIIYVNKEIIDINILGYISEEPKNLKLAKNIVKFEVYIMTGKGKRNYS